MPRSLPISRTFSLAAVTVAAAVALSGCAFFSSERSEAEMALDVAYMGIMGSIVEEPVTAEAGLRLFIMSCGQEATGCSVPTAALKEAGEAIGWNVTVTDGKLNPVGFAEAIQQAIDGDADVLIPVGIDCTSAPEAFVAAKEAGIVVVGGGGMNDCEPIDGELVWSSERLWVNGKGSEDVWRMQGALQANYLIGKADAEAKVLLVTFSDQVWGPWITEGFTKRLEACAGCEIVATVEISNAQWNDGTAPSVFAEALASTPEANAVAVPIDGWLTAGIADAVLDSGRNDELWVIGRGGDPGNIELIKNNAGQDASVAYAAEWGAWGSVDTAARILASKTPLYVGEAIQVVDAERNLPEAGQAYQGRDFREAYLAAWGLASEKG